MHRNKLHQGANTATSTAELPCKIHLSEPYTTSNVSAGVGVHIKPEDGRNHSSEEKRSNLLNFISNEVETSNEANSSHESTSIIKDEEPPSVTSSGCSPPINPDITSHKQESARQIEENINVSNNRESLLKTEPSSTKGNRNQRSPNGDDSYLPFKSVKEPTNLSSKRNKEKECKLINMLILWQ